MEDWHGAPIKSSAEPEGQFLSSPRQTPTHMSLPWLKGRLVTSQCAPEDNPRRFDLPPGHYIVASESNDTVTKVRVDIQDGEETVVPESHSKRLP